MRMTKREKLLVANAINVLDELADSLKGIPSLYEERCVIDDELIPRLRDELLAGVEEKWRERAKK